MYSKLLVFVPFLLGLKCKNAHVIFFGEKCRLNFKIRAKISITVNFFDFLTHHFLPVHLSLEHVADLCIYLPLYDHNATEDDALKS